MARRSRVATTNRQLTGLRNLLGIYKHSLAAQRKIDLDNARLDLLHKNAEVTELRVAEMANKVMLQDLKILEMKKKLGISEEQQFSVNS